MSNKEPQFAENSIFNKIYADLKKNCPALLDIPPEDLADKTPADVMITTEARKPQFDASLGIPIAIPDEWQNEKLTRNRLVAIGDSLTHGFQSGAIFNTAISYPAIIAYEMGWGGLRYPSYRGFGGLPLNIELLIRTLEAKFGSKLNWWELASAIFSLRQQMAETEDWWERGAGSHVPQFDDFNHNLAVYGWDVRDVLSRTADFCQSQIGKPKDQLFKQIVEHANERAALRVLNYQNDGASPKNKMTVLEQAAALGEAEEIETLIVFVGANNALGSVLKLEVKWSDAGYDNLTKKSDFNVWRPTHFENEFNLLVEQVKKIKARRVIFTTVPHVTITPVARGVGEDKIRPNSRYYLYYTRPWIKDGDFNSKDDPSLSAPQARAIDSAIDQYNYCIENAVKVGRENGNHWYLLDAAGLLDRLASRRYINSPQARPSWWTTEYELPAEFNTLGAKVDSSFFSTTRDGERVRGGLFSLDGVHPTTIAYGILAQEFINIMQNAGVPFYLGDGETPRNSPVRVDFNRLIALDTLISDPPSSVSTDMQLIGWIDDKADFFKRMLLL